MKQATIGKLLQSGPLDALDNRILVMHALGLTRVQLITQSERVLSQTEHAAIKALVQRRFDGEPIAYIVGTREFYGLPFRVTPDVLIPRPETELLVELALQYSPPQGAVLDMGTGSGAIAIAIAHTRRDVRVCALDASIAALEVAQDNANHLAEQVDFLNSDWYLALGEQRFDVIVSNPPYIVDGDHHLSQGDLRFEPIDALTDHDDGLSAIRAICAGAPHHLLPGGRLFIEHGYDQAEAVRALIAQNGLSEVQSWRDLAGIERVSAGVRQAHDVAAGATTRKAPG